jgi:tetratricopeptide (TPR) repeat protein
VVLKRLLARGLISSRLAHVEGERRTKKVYFLTPSGHEQARKLAQAERMCVLRPDGLQFPRLFVGREAEVREILRWAKEDRRRALFVRGLPGIGKTTLLLRCADRLRAGTHLLYFRFHEWSSAALMFRELGEFLGAMGRRCLSSYVESCAARGAPLDAGLALAEAERDLAGERALLVFDDVHDAPAECAEALGVLLEIAERGGARILAAGRHLARPFDARAVASGRAKEVGLEGLGEGEVKELVKRRVSGITMEEAQVERARRATGGNPLFLELLDAGGPGGGAGGLASFLRREVDERLSARAREVARRLCVFRSPVPFDWFAVRGEEEAVGELMSRSIVAFDDDSKRYGMHDALREFFLGSMDERERSEQHARAARALSRAEGPEQALELISNLIAAGDRVAAVERMRSFEDSLVRSGRAAALLPLVDELISGGKDAALLLLRGRCLREAGDLNGAAAALREARRTATDPLAAARAASLLSNVLVLQDDREAAARACLDGLGLIAKVPRSRERDEVRQRLQRDLGSVNFMGGDYLAAAKAFGEALGLARRVGTTGDVLACRNNLAACHSRLGMAQRALEELRAAANEEGALDDAWFGPLLLDNIGVLELDAGDYDAALEACGKALRLAERARNRLRVISVVNNLGTLHSNRGEYALAESHFKRGIALAKELEHRHWTAWVTTSLARMCVLMGQAGRALALLGGVADAVRKEKEARLAHVFARTRAQAHAALGEERECEGALREAEASLKGAGTPRMRGELPLARAVLRLRLKEPSVAEREAREAARTFEEERGDPFDEARAAEALGEALAAGGRKEEARASMSRAASLYGEIGAANAAERCARKVR